MPTRDMSAPVGGQADASENSGALTYAWPDEGAPYDRIDWAVPNFAARGEVTMLWSDGGLGTTTLLVAGSAKWTRGRDFLGLEPERPLQILASCPETDFHSMIRPAFELQGGDRSLFAVVNAAKPQQLVDKNGKVLRALIDKHGPDLVWIDPLMSHGGKVNWIDAGQARGYMDLLQAIARDFGVAVIVRDHWNKSSGVTDATYRGSGSSQKVNAPRMNFQGAPYPGEEYTFVLSLDKCNLPASFQDRKLRTHLLGRGTDAIGIEDCGPSDLSVDAILQLNAQKKTPRVSNKKVIGDFLEAFRGEWITLDQAEQVYGEFGLTRKQISNAVGRLGGLVERREGAFRMITQQEWQAYTAQCRETGEAFADARALARVKSLLEREDGVFPS
jgi:AAA domain